MDTLISREVWQDLRQKHLNAVLPFTTHFRQRRSRREKHPVYDFLFTYYTFSPGKLEEWYPGYGVVLEASSDAISEGLLRNRFYKKFESGISLSLSEIGGRLVKELSWVRDLCRSIQGREPRFSCLGLHEWAMIYRSTDIRHAYPLRLSPDEINRLLETTSYGCSHFDAFRFSSPAARSLNVLQPSASTRLQFEQGGCLHANMDLYKWCFKLYPLISSELLRKSFLLAAEAREIDMRASPYDLLSLGFTPIKIETAEGQAEYRQAQRDIADKAAVLRAELLSAAEQLLSVLPQHAQSVNSQAETIEADIR